MAYTFNKPKPPLFDDDFTVVEEVINNVTTYKLENWYQYLHNSTVPLSYVTSNNDFALTREKGLKIGGDVVSNNSVFLVSNKFFKYDPTVPYILKCRLKSNTEHLIKFGFIGLTSRPTIIKDNVNTLYEKEMFNLHRFVFSHNEVVNDPQTNPIYSTEHYVPINKNYTPVDTYAEYIGFIKGTDVEVIYSTTKGTTLATAVPLNTRCEYFMPFISLNTAGNVSSIIDYFTIQDSFDLYDTPVVLPEETVLNNSTYF